MLCRSLLAASTLASTVVGGAFIIDNDFSRDTFMPILYGLANSNENNTLIGITTVSGNTWGGQGQAWAQRYLQLASSNTTDDAPSKLASQLGAFRGALLPLLRTQPVYEAGIGLTGVIDFAGAWATYNSTAESMGIDPTGDETNVARVTLKGFDAPSQPLGASLNSSANVNAVQYLVQTAADYRRKGENLTIVALGPLTNLALATKLDPEFAKSVTVVYAGVYLNFNMQLLSPADKLGDYYNDFNTLFDPEAAAIVVRANWTRLTVVGEPSASVIPSPATLDQATAGIGGRSTVKADTNPTNASQYFAQRLLYPAEPFLPVWDEVTLGVALHPERYVTNTTQGYLDIGTSVGSWNYGRSFAYPSQQAPKYLVRAEIVTGLNNAAFLDDYAKAAAVFIR